MVPATTDRRQRRSRLLGGGRGVVASTTSTVLVIGLLRVFYFEKGASYYFHSIPFIVKLSLFAVVGLVSIYPTMQFLSWRGALKEGRAPIVAPTSHQKTPATRPKQ